LYGKAEDENLEKYMTPVRSSSSKQNKSVTSNKGIEFTCGCISRFSFMTG